MSTLHKTLLLDAPATRVWEALRDFGALHTRLARGFVTGTAMEGESVRVVTFFNGATARETLVSRDDARRRLAYAIVGGRAAHYGASAQVFDEGGGRSRFEWTVDLLPDEIAPYVDDMMTRGAAAMQATLEAVAADGAGAARAP